MKITHRFVMLTVIIGVIAIAGCGKKPESDNSPTPAPDSKPVPTPPKDSTPKPPTNLADAKPDVKFTANEFEAENKKEFGFLRTKHPGKVVEVTGVLKSFGSFEANRLVVLESDNPIGTMFKLEDNQAWLKILPRQTVTLRTVAPTDRNQLVVNWQVITVTGSPPPTIPAADYLKESKTGGNAIEAKYGKGLLIVSGTIADVKAEMTGTTVQLAAEKDENLTCVFPGATFAPIPMTEAQQKALKPGLKVKILGQPAGVSLILCVLLEPAP